NEVTIAGDADIGGDVFGGSVGGNGNASGNKVTLSGDAKVIQSLVYGGHTTAGNATGNTVTIEDNVQIDYGVYGGRTGNGDASQNTVVMTGGTLGDAVYGGHVESYGAGECSDNTFTIRCGSVDSVTGR